MQNYDFKMIMIMKYYHSKYHKMLNEIIERIIFVQRNDSNTRGIVVLA